jgi:hypothetical protein
MKKILLLGATVLFFAGPSFAQTGKDGKGKARDSTRTSSTINPNSTVKPCPGKTCGKKKN